MSLISDLVSWGVLDRSNRSACNGFTLSEEVWKLLARSLAWLEPVDSKGFVGSIVANLDHDLFTLNASFVKVDFEGVSKVLVQVGESLELSLIAAILGADMLPILWHHLDTLVIEDNMVNSILVACHVMDNITNEGFLIEVNIHVKVKMISGHLINISVSTWILTIFESWCL